MVGRIHGVLLPFIEVFEICFKVRKLRTNGALKNTSVVPTYFSEQQIDHHPVSTKDQVRLHPAFLSKAKRTNPILQVNNENETNWKQQFSLKYIRKLHVSSSCSSKT